jgi:hypothetical protein
MQVGLAHRESLNKRRVVKGFKYKPLIRESLLKVLPYPFGDSFSASGEDPMGVQGTG